MHQRVMPVPGSMLCHLMVMLLLLSFCSCGVRVCSTSTTQVSLMMLCSHANGGGRERGDGGQRESNQKSGEAERACFKLASFTGRCATAHAPKAKSAPPLTHTPTNKNTTSQDAPPPGPSACLLC